MSESEGYEDECVTVYEFLKKALRDPYATPDADSNDGDAESLCESLGWLCKRKYYGSTFISKEGKGNIFVGFLEDIVSVKAFSCQYLIQIWTPESDAAGIVHLTASDNPFAVNLLANGLAWYRGHTMFGEYSVGDGPVGRVYETKKPESTPDLRMYSSEEFMYVDEASTCGGRFYFVLPVFPLFDSKECIGVLEIFCIDESVQIELAFDLVEQALKANFFRSAHIEFPVPNNWDDRSKIQPVKYKRNSDSEVTKTLERAVEIVPQLQLAQVWVPCPLCPYDASTETLRCMERIMFITSHSCFVNSFNFSDFDLFRYIQACEFHSVMQVGKESWRCGNVCDFTMCNNPLAHYARKANLSCRFLVCAHMDREVLFEFFIQSDSIDYFPPLCTILRIVESGSELNREPIALTHLLGESYERMKKEVAEGIKSVEVIESPTDHISVSEFRKHLHDSEKFVGEQCNNEGWFIWRPEAAPTKIEPFMRAIVQEKSCYCVVQFWEYKVLTDGVCYLNCSDQPFIVGRLAKGLANFRNMSMKLNYRVDEGAEDELVGPVGRAFRHGEPECTPDLRFYTEKEFPLRYCDPSSCLKEYVALPVFRIDDTLQKDCLGVVELAQFTNFQVIQKELLAVSLSSRLLPCLPVPAEDIAREISQFLGVVTDIPQVHMAEVWSRCTRCHSNSRCMERTHSTLTLWNDSMALHSTRGITEMVLASNKLCFFQNTSHFAIRDEPRSHYLKRARSNSCMGICLKSSNVGDLMNVALFFLNQGPSKECTFCILDILLENVKAKLKSFAIASGQKLEEELPIEVSIFPGEDPSVSEITSHDRCKRKFKFIKFVRECVGDSKKTVKRKERSVALDYEEVKLQLGKKLEEAAAALGVSRSTVSRVYKKNTNKKWPSSKLYKENPSFYEEKIEGADKDATNAPDDKEDSELVMVYVKHEDCLIKFESNLSAGIEKIKQTVARKLKLEMNSFRLNYLDKDNEHVYIADDDDLKNCKREVKQSGTTSIRLFVVIV